MIPQLEQYFFHLKGSRKSLDQNSSPDSIHRDADVRLREVEYVIPETRFQVVLHLRKVEVGTRTTLDEFFGIVVKVECEIEDGTRHRGVVDSDSWFVQMPSSGSEHVIAGIARMIEGTLTEQSKQRVIY